MFIKYGLSITLAALFLFSWFGQLYFQWQEFIQTQIAHGEETQISNFIPEFLSSTFENWQSEFLQLFTFVLLSTYLIHLNSPQSRDSSDRMEKKIDEILEKIGPKVK